MGWITLSLRKMVLTQRISDLEHRLTKLSQEKQTMANSSGYSQRALAMQKNMAYTNLANQHSANMQSIFSQYGGYVSDTSVASQIQNNIYNEEIGYMMSKMNLDSYYESIQSAQDDAINVKEQNIDLEIEQLEVQLQAARAEAEKIDEAVSSDIKSSTISLV